MNLLTDEGVDQQVMGLLRKERSVSYVAEIEPGVRDEEVPNQANRGDRGDRVLLGQTRVSGSGVPPGRLFAGVGLPQVGALLPYAEDADALAGQQFRRHEAWLEAMERAGLERRLFAQAGEDLLRPAWNPVRLNSLGTVELRGMDSNLPEVTLSAAALVLAAAGRVRREGLTVTPDDEIRAFAVDGERPLVPGFACLGDGRPSLTPRGPGDGYPTTEAAIRKEYGSAVAGGRISEEEGLRLAREVCDALEGQVSRLQRGNGEGAAVGAL